MLSSDLFKFAISPIELIARSLVIYVVLLVLLRVFGKRQVGQFTLYDLVFVLLVANALQPAITGPDTSLGGGLVIAAALVLLNYTVARLDRVPLLHRLLVPSATKIVENGKLLRDAMDREGVDEDDCAAAIREHGLKDIDDVLAAYLEPDGSISVIPKDEAGGHGRGRRRRRLFRHRQG